jgi:hypothetical protein
MRASRSSLARVAVALAIGVAYPYLELAWKCRNGYASSEACVWGRALLPLDRWLEPFIVAPVAFVILWALARFLGALKTRSSEL